MYYDEAPGAFTGIAMLSSPTYPRSGSHCEMEFYYYKNDSGSITLGLYAIDENGYAERLWTRKEPSEGNTWMRMAVGIFSRKNFKLHFEAVQISNTKPALLAIDDVNFINCQVYPNTSCFNENVFECKNRYCIPDNLVNRIISDFVCESLFMIII